MLGSLHCVSAKDVKVTIAVVWRCFSFGIVHGVLLATWFHIHDHLKLVPLGDVEMLGFTALFTLLLQPVQDTMITVGGLCLWFVKVDIRPQTMGEKIIQHIAYALLATGTLGGAVGVVDQCAPVTCSVALKFAACTAGYVFVAVTVELHRALRTHGYGLLEGCALDMGRILWRKSLNDFGEKKVWLLVRVPWFVALATYPSIERAWTIFWHNEGPGSKYVGLGVTLGLLWFFLILATCKICGEVMLEWWSPQKPPLARWHADATLP